MKKKHLIYIGAGVLILLLIALFWDPILDFLPIDQSGWQVEDGSYRYLDENGDPLTGWQTLEGKRRYLDPDTGIMHTGWLETDTGTYYLETDGTLRTGWYTRNAEPCYLGNDGALTVGWLEVDGRRYYMDAGGNPTLGLFNAGGQSYYADGTGAVLAGWQEIDGSRYYFSNDFTMHTGWLETNAGVYYFSASGIMETGWVDVAEDRYYLDETGLRCSGWLETDGTRFYLEKDGSLYTGWLNLDGKTYYLTTEGPIARGTRTIDGQTYFFTASGVNFLMVNRWNPVPEGYTTELLELESGMMVSAECYDSLLAMLQACSDAGCSPIMTDGYRSNDTQRDIFGRYLDLYLSQGNDYETAFAMTSLRVADPGTSEHELGLAVDLGDAYASSSNMYPMHSLYWLSEHCWEYGWILRYPPEKSDITGITYEPWHFRYVGVELALELKDSGLCLEEYLDLLTDDGTTCGKPKS